jgi:hypothetical protein
VINNIDNAWIGDAEGFGNYQCEFHSLDNDLSIKDKMRTAFRSVIDNDDLKTIGDFHISTAINYEINPAHPVFLHGLNIEIEITEPQLIEIEKKEQPKPIPLGSRQGGSHGISYLSTASPNFHGVAVHFTHGEFGVLFCPQISFEGVILKNISGRNFVEKIKNDFDIPLRGFIKMNDTAVQYVDTREFDDAQP